MIPQKPTSEWVDETSNSAEPDSPPQSSDDTSLTIPLINEQLQVSKQLIETGRIRLTKTVHQHEQDVQIPLLQEDVVIERVVMDQFVDDVPVVRQEGDTMIYPVLKEEFVILKRLRLVEEIRVTRRQFQTTDTQTVSLRQEEITIDRIAPNPELSSE
ncbi:YsnF/AvaK domain-containing protein [Spirosoma fluminis]